MGRGKLRLQPITDEKVRREGFEKRKKGLEKAAHELSTLCGVNIGMIVHGKDSDQPTIWPRNQEVIAGLIESYMSRLVHDDGRKKTYNLSDFFKEQTEKVEDELEKLMRKKKREVKYPMLDNDKYNCMSLEELKQFHGGLMAKIDSVRGKINMMKGSSTSLFTESDVLMNQYYSVQESRVLDFVPSMLNYDSLQANNMYNHMMMNHNGALLLCRQGSYNSNYAYDNFDDNLSNYAYGFETEMTENHVMKAEPLISYSSAQNVEPSRYYYNETI